MSTEFYLPIAVKLAPSKWMTVTIVALHCLPLPLLAVIFDAPVAIAVTLLTLASLTFHQRRQTHAAHATDLTAHARPTAEEEWWLRYADGRSARVELIAQINLGWWVLLLLSKNRRRFRVLVPVKGQHAGEVHRLRVKGARD